MEKEENKKFSYWAYLVYGFYSYYRRRDSTPMIFTVIGIGLVITLYLLSLINLYGLITKTYSVVNLIFYLCVYLGSILTVYFITAFDNETIDSYCKYFDRSKYNKNLSSGLFAFIVSFVGLTLFIITIFFLREAMLVV